MLEKAIVKQLETLLIQSLCSSGVQNGMRFRTSLKQKRRGSNSAVECQLPKLDVAGSIPVSRSMFSITWEELIISGLVRLVR